MTMPRESMRAQMQNQRPARKRQLCEVSPSPPTKWRRFLSSNSPASSPSKGPLMDNDEDEAPSFRARSFYGSRKKLSVATPLPVDWDSENSASSTATISSSAVRPNTENVERTKRQTRSISPDDKKLRTRSCRVALSPIKNTLDKLKKEISGKPAPRAVARRRSKSLPPRARSNPRRKKQQASQPVKSVENVREARQNSTPDNSRKFFKYKSPGSATKSTGSVIVGRGFNLKFVKGSAGKDFGQSPGRKRSTTPGSSKTCRRKNATSTKTPKRNGSAMSAGSSQLLSSNSTPASDISLQSTSGTPGPTQDSPGAESESRMSDIDSPVPGSLSQSLFSSDSQSAASDMSEPVEDEAVAVIDREVVSVEGLTEGGDKFFSVFSKKRRSLRLTAVENSHTKKATDSPKRKFITAKGDDTQLMLDAGQDKFGATQCQLCGMVYSPADPADEATHAKFHQSALATLKFPGWKKERVVEEFLDNGGRVIAVLPEDPHFMVKKVEEVNRVMGQELGFPDHVFSFHGSIKAFLYISDDKRIEGCCIAETIGEGYRIIPNKPSKECGDSQRPWYCSAQPEPAAVGIGRLWVYGPSRQHGIATRLVDCIRQWFEYGMIMDKSQIAFSDPTPDGRKFAAKYTGNTKFLVYKYQH